MKIDNSVISGAYKTAATQEKTAMEADGFKDMLEKAAEGNDLTKLKEASQEFEAFFINTLFKEMRKTIQESGLTEKSQATTTFEDMLDEEMSQTISKTGGLGLADMIYNNMVKVYANNAAISEDVKAKTEGDSESEPDENNPISIDIKG